MKKLTLSLVFFALLAPSFAGAADFGKIIPDCNQTPPPGQTFEQAGSHECGFKDLVQLAVNLMRFLVELSTVIAIIVFAYAGLRLITSGGDTKARGAAIHAATSVLKGYIAIILAWLIVYTIFSALSSDTYSLLKP